MCDITKGSLRTITHFFSLGKCPALVLKISLQIFMEKEMDLPTHFLLFL